MNVNIIHCGFEGGGGGGGGGGLQPPAGADPGFWERGGLINIFTTGGRVREWACPLP